MQRPPVRPRSAAWPRLSIVIPTLNEARNIGLLLRELDDDLHEVIIVDGHSTDGTIEAALAVRPDCRIVRQPGWGKGDALTTGFSAATGDIIVALDADGSADPAEIPVFVGALLAGADFSKGSRHLVGGGSADLTRLRGVGNRALSMLVNALFRTRFTDLCYGYNAFWRDCLPDLSLDCSGFEIETLMNIRAVKAGLRVSEVPSFERARRHGASNLRAASDGWRVLRTILRERRGGPPARASRARVSRAPAPTGNRHAEGAQRSVA
jgi:glycosyltransferase involved in cell wall biosynthesis